MERLRKLRVNKALYQKDIAKYLGVDRTTYVKYETGVSEPDYATLMKLAEYFKVSTDYLLGKKYIDPLTGIEFDPYENGVVSDDPFDAAKELYGPALINNLTEHERNVIFAYRQNSDMQFAVDKLLGVSDDFKPQ